MLHVLVVAPACKQARAGWQAFLRALDENPVVCGVNFVPLESVGKILERVLLGEGSAGAADGPDEEGHAAEPCEINHLQVDKDALERERARLGLRALPRGGGALEHSAPAIGEAVACSCECTAAQGGGTRGPSKIVVVHKPQLVFLPGYPVDARRYEIFLKLLLGAPLLLDSLSSIAQSVSRAGVSELLRSAGIPAPRVVRAGGVSPAASAACGTTETPPAPFSAPLLVKPINSALHALRYCGSWADVAVPALLPPSTPLEEMLCQEFVRHTRLYKVYSFEGRINKLEARGSLDTFVSPSSGAGGVAKPLDFDSQTCAAVKTRLDEDVPEPVQERLAEIARRAHARFRLSYMGIDVLHSLSDELLVCDVNYMSGPKESEAPAVAAQTVDLALRRCAGGPAAGEGLPGLGAG